MVRIDKDVSDRACYLLGASGFSLNAVVLGDALGGAKAARVAARAAAQLRC